MDYTNNNTKIAVITSGFLPVPASKGGASENLLETLVNQNETYKRVRLIIFSVYDEEAVNISKKYTESDFIFIKTSYLSRMLDATIYFIIDKVLRKGNSRKYRYIFQRLDFFRKCSIELSKNQFDKVLLENHTIMYLALKWKKNYLKFQDNYYYHCHNEIPSKYSMDNIIKKTKKFISVSQFRNNYVKEFFGVDDTKCSVVLNCCSEDIYQKATDEEKKFLKEKHQLDNCKVIMYVGRVDSDKGTLELVKAANKLQFKDYKLLIVGAPIFATGITTEYENLVKNEVLKNEHVIMTGYVKHEELYKYYSIADIVVIPSQVEDSAPLVLIEALSCGVPVVASNSGGIPEYSNEKCANLVNRGKGYIDKLSTILEQLLQDENALKEMSQEAVQQSNKYSAIKYYNDLIDELIEG